MDARLRELEMKWKETGTPDDRQAYAQGLKRTQNYEAVARLYAPILEGRPSKELGQEYLLFSPIREEDKPNLEFLLGELGQIDELASQFCRETPYGIWMFGPALINANYQAIDLCGKRKHIIVPSNGSPELSKIREIEERLYCLTGTEPLIYDGVTPLDADIPLRARIQNTVLNWGAIEQPFSRNPTKLRVRLR
ncbi:hypothetical protein J4219_07780 [Candidatus Woesearchaeota archaeon]|nr:hypothetical protein [Candidatus Woesearchaeota archaeon]